MAKIKKSDLVPQEEQEMLAGGMPGEAVEVQAAGSIDADAAEFGQLPADGGEPLLLPDESDDGEQPQAEESGGSPSAAHDEDWPPEDGSPLPEEYGEVFTGDGEASALMDAGAELPVDGDAEDPLPSGFDLPEDDGAEEPAEDTAAAPDVLLDAEADGLMGGGDTLPAGDAAPADTAKPQKPSAAAKAPTTRRRQTAAPVLTIERRAEVETAASREELIWHEIQNAARTRRMLTGTLGGIERLENGKSVAVVYYKDLRIIIPVKEMMLQLGAENPNYGTMAERESKILNNMLGCDIDFVIKGIDSKTKSAVASRREAMLRKRKLFYVDVDEALGSPRIYEGRIVQARVVAVASKIVRVEAFGVETSIMARDLSWEWIGDAHERYTVGDRILIRVNQIRAGEIEALAIQADARSMTENTVAENLKKCHVQGKYAGTVTDIHKGVVFIRLAIGVNAIAHSCLDKRMPAKQDSVSFVVTHIDDEQGVAMGLITRIIKQQI